MRDRALSLCLVLLISTVYYATASGVTSSNDGSTYALMRSIVDEHHFQINSFYGFTENIDAAVRNGKIYSDRAPGTAVLAAPFYVVGDYLPHPIVDMPSKHDNGNPRLAYIVMLPVLMGAGTAVLLYWFLRHYSLSVFASLTTSLAFAFGTVNWKYSSALFTHGPSGFLILAGIIIAVRSTRTGYLRFFSAWLLGLVLGLSVLVEYSNALFVATILVYLGLSLRGTLLSARGWWLALVALAGGGIVPAGFLLWYNALNFGNPFTTSYAYNVSFPWATHIATTFSFPLGRGLLGMLWTGPDANGLQNQGLFLLMPVTIVALGGVRAYIRRYRAEAALVLGVFILYLLLFSTHRTFGGGSTADGRYLSPFLALLFVPLGFVLELLQHHNEDAFRRTFLFMAIYGLLFLSVRNMLVHIALSENYSLNPAYLQPKAAWLGNWRYILGSIFVNWRNIPLLWSIEISVMVLLVAFSWIRTTWGTRLAVLSNEWLPHQIRQPLALSGLVLFLIAVPLGILGYFWPVYQVPSISAISAASTHALSLTYADVAELVSIEPPLVRAQPGSAVGVTLTWRALRPTDDKLMVYLHSLGSNLVRFDRWPAGGNLLATNWAQGQTWTENYVIVIPSQTETQVTYPLVSGLYDPEAEYSLRATDDSGNEVTPFVGVIAINGPARPFEPAYRFGDVIGLAEPRITRQGNDLEVCLRWLSVSSTSTDYQIFIHVLSDGSEMIAQADFQPKNGLYPTSVWAVGEVIDDCVTLNAQLPDKWKAAVGLYELSSGQRLPVMDRGGHLLDNDMVVIAP